LVIVANNLEQGHWTSTGVLIFAATGLFCPLI